MTSLQGKKALVTGAGRGIGAAIARRLVADGAAVALRDLPPERLSKLSSAFGRRAGPAEIASAVAFLVPADASCITGSTLAVDGGRM